jgi:phospholipid/cholesterol/gamma-HCH transport system substrate-binding protein
MTETLADRLRRRGAAIALLLLIAGFTALCVAGYRQAFTDTVDVTLRADRTGLQMYPGNRVQLRGVDVGRVGAVDLSEDGRGAIVTLRMQPDRLAEIPVNVGVELNQLTAFGAKSVALVYPDAPSGSTLSAGDELGAHSVAVEVNTLFDNVEKLLDVASPAEVSAVLGNLAAALDGRGQQLGDTAVQLSAYLQRFNENLPTLQEDLAKTAEVANLYADIGPDLSTVLESATVTSRTLVDQQAELDSFMFQVTRAGYTGRDFFGQNADGLVSLVGNLLPTTRLLEEYSPEFACLLQGIDKASEQMFATQGIVPGITGLVGLEAGDVDYTEPTTIAASAGPHCHGMPNLDGRVLPDSVFDIVDPSGEANPDGDNRVRLGDRSVVAQLFGPLAGLPLTDIERAEADLLQLPGKGPS